MPKEEKNMAKGENIFKRKDGRWEARFVKGYDSAGKIRCGYCYGKSYKEAKEKVQKAKNEFGTDKVTRIQNSKRDFSYYCDEWIRINRNRIKESTFVKYTATIEKYIKPRLGAKQPLSLSSSMISEFSNKLLEEDGLSAKTVRDILIVLHSILKYTSVQFQGELPAIEIVYPKGTKKEMRVLTFEEQNCLMEYLLEDMDPCKFGILLALLTGLRIGEICALKWENISLEDRIIRIGSTMQRIRDFEEDSETKTKVVIGAPKTDTSLRIIPLTNYAVELCSQMEDREPEFYVLTGRKHYMEPRTLQYRLKKYTQECGLEDVHFHTLRHTFATRCVEVGFEIKSLSEILGHSTTTVTLERYVHSSIELKRNNMEKLASVGL